MKQVLDRSLDMCTRLPHHLTASTANTASGAAGPPGAERASDTPSLPGYRYAKTVAGRLNAVR